jgi:hypothetical protein
MVPPVPAMQFQLESYATRVRALSVVWFIYAGLALVGGFVGMTFARGFMFNHFGPWGRWNGPFRPEWFGPAILQFMWVFLVLRAALLFGAAWGLMERAPWGRVLAVVAAFLSLFKFMGYRNQTLYDQLR